MSVGTSLVILGKLQGRGGVMNCLEQVFEGSSAEAGSSPQLFYVAPPSFFGTPVMMLRIFFVNLPLSLEDLKRQICSHQRF